MEERASEGLDGTREGGGVRKSGVEAEDGDVLLPCGAVLGVRSLAGGREYTPAPCWDLTKRVARSIQTIKQPVTLGSRVPL